jgi:outer membrane receptor protein involved in Fe transport
LNLRGNFFWDEIVNPIANVTLDANSNPVQRQRQNLGRTRSRGVELDALARLTTTIELSGGYQFVDAVVRSFPADPTNNPPLVGLELPQIPRHQFTLQARYYNPSGFTLSVQGRFAGSQFEDDLNTAPLGRYFTVDLLVGRSLGHGVEAFAAVENLFNQQYEVGRNPTPTLGPPFLGRVGLRFNLPQH